MKCQRCKGEGKLEYPGFADRYFQCPKCNGTGEVEMTNEEYIRTCSTEELAEFITKVILSDRRFRMTMVGGVEETKAWLKEKHE